MEVPQASPSPAATPPSPDLTARLARLVDQARDAHREFDSRRSRAERTVAAGGRSGRGSEGWSVASVALADLESARSDAMIALADLDQIYAATRINGGDGTAIAAARDQVMTWIGEEDRVLAGLRSRLGT